MNDIIKRITLNPEICHGQPVLRNTRYLVSAINEYLAGGDSDEDLLATFTDLEKDDIAACRAYDSKIKDLKDEKIF